MKKVFALLLALAMTLSLVACGAKEEPAKTEEPAKADGDGSSWSNNAPSLHEALVFFENFTLPATKSFNTLNVETPYAYP